MSLTQSDGASEPLFSPDGVAGTRQSTARLLGAFINRERKRRHMSVDVLAKSLNRTPAWVIAVERGEVIPTEMTIVLLEGGFLDADSRGMPDDEKHVDVGAALLELEKEPYGVLAQALRTELGLRVEFDELPESGAPIGEGLVPVVSSIRSQDRLLILAPMLVGIATGIVGFQTVRWSQGGAAYVDLSTQIVAGATLLAFTAFFLEPFDRFLAALCRWFRDPSMSEVYRSFQATRAVNGLQSAPVARGGWFTPRDEPHLLVGAREPAARYGLLADFSERLAALLTLVLFAAAVLAVVLSVHDGSTTRENALWVFAAIVGLVLIAVKETARDASRRLEGVTVRGLGRAVPE